MALSRFNFNSGGFSPVIASALGKGTEREREREYPIRIHSELPSGIKESSISRELETGIFLPPQPWLLGGRIGGKLIVANWVSYDMTLIVFRQ